MTEQFNEPVDPTAEGQRRAAAQRAHLEASQAASTAAEVQAHRSTSAVLRASQHGIMGDVTPQQQAAMVAAQRRIGDGAGAGRELQAQGGTIPWESYGSAPAPARVDLTGLNSPPGYRRTENPLKRLHEGRG